MLLTLRRRSPSAAVPNALRVFGLPASVSAPAHRRAEVVTVVYVLSYLSPSLPAVPPRSPIPGPSPHHPDPSRRPRACARQARALTAGRAFPLEGRASSNLDHPPGHT
ncbi:hypothetical protein GCM10009738_48670 [Kitasatospora viridis]